MQEKENVITENNQTEQGSTINQAQNAEGKQVGSTDLGKFKDVNALLQAYESLQAEFTRRSQRLKRYEEADKQGSSSGVDTAQEVLEAAAADASQSAPSPDSPMEEGIVKSQTNAMRLQVRESVDGEHENMGKNGVCETFSGSDGANAAPSLYEQVLANEEVRLRIIGDYLSSIGKSGAPLMKGGTGVLATPLQKPSTVSQAGNMALCYFKAQSGQA